MRRIVAVLFVCLALGGCGRPAAAKASCSSLDLQVASDPGVPEATLNSFQKRLNVLLFSVAKIQPGSACHLNITLTTVAPGGLAREPDPLHFDLPREGAGRAMISAQLRRGDEEVWSNSTEMVFAVDTPEVRTSMLLRTFFETTDFAGAINPFAVVNADVVYANLCTLADSELTPKELSTRVSVLRYRDLSTGLGTPCSECWPLLFSGGVDKILFDPLGPEQKDFEAAFGPVYRSRYLSALKTHLNIANSLTGEPVALTMIGVDQDRVPILYAEPAAGLRPDAIMSFDRLGLNLGTNIGNDAGNRGANINTTSLEILGPAHAAYTRSIVTYGKGMGVNDCASRPGIRAPKQLVDQFIYINGGAK